MRRATKAAAKRQGAGIGARPTSSKPYPEAKTGWGSPGPTKRSSSSSSRSSVSGKMSARPRANALLRRNGPSPQAMSVPARTTGSSTSITSTPSRVNSARSRRPRTTGGRISSSRRCEQRQEQEERGRQRGKTSSAGSSSARRNGEDGVAIPINLRNEWLILETYNQLLREEKQEEEKRQAQAGTLVRRDASSNSPTTPSALRRSSSEGTMVRPESEQDGSNCHYEIVGSFIDYFDEKYMDRRRRPLVQRHQRTHECLANFCCCSDPAVQGDVYCGANIRNGKGSS